MRTHARHILQIAGALFLASCSKEHEVSSQWVPQPMAVDGHVDEWTEIALNRFEEGNLSWGVVNDSESLYLLLVTWDQPLIRMLWMRGITLRFGENKDDSAACGVRVSGGAWPQPPPHTVPSDQELKEPPGSGPPTFQDLNERPAPPAPPDPDTPAIPHGPSRPLDLALFSGTESIDVATTGLSGMTGAASCAGPTCSYEIRIPLSAGGGRPCSVKTRPGEKVRIRAELVVPVMPPGLESGGMGGGAPGRGMGGGMGGGPPGGMGGGMGGMGGGPPGGMGGGMGGMGGGSPGGMGGGMGGTGRPPDGMDGAGGDQSKAGRKSKGRGPSGGEPVAMQFETKEIVLIVTLAAQHASSQ
jgi:hypothetical protein